MVIFLSSYSPFILDLEFPIMVMIMIKIMTMMMMMIIDTRILLLRESKPNRKFTHTEVLIITEPDQGIQTNNISKRLRENSIATVLKEAVGFSWYHYKSMEL